jgi:hypothetical protein
MKKAVLLISMFSLVLWSCGDKKAKPQEVNKKTIEVTTKVVNKTKKPTKSIGERKEKGKIVRVDLKKFKLNIPDTLLYLNTVIDGNAFKKSTFKVTSVDENLKKVLDDWYTQQSKDFVSNKWERTRIQNNEKVSGMIFNTYSFKRAQGGKSTLFDVITLTSVYDASRQTYIVYAKPYILEN